MSKYIKLEDAIRKYAEMFADEAYWEHGVGNGKPDEEDLDIAREYYSDLPTIDIVECEECRWRDVCSQVVSDIGCEVDTLLRWCSDGERKDNE